jgi:hypothetical protein
MEGLADWWPRDIKAPHVLAVAAGLLMITAFYSMHSQPPPQQQPLRCQQDRERGQASVSASASSSSPPPRRSDKRAQDHCVPRITLGISLQELMELGKGQISTVCGKLRHLTAAFDEEKE